LILSIRPLKQTAIHKKYDFFSKNTMKIILSAVEKELYEAWKTFCGDLPDVEVFHGSILDLSVDAIVSPANSYGFTDGGIDLLYSHRFG
jgi:hypothetical protein